VQSSIDCIVVPVAQWQLPSSCALTAVWLQRQYWQFEKATSVAVACCQTVTWRLSGGQPCQGVSTDSWTEGAVVVLALGINTLYRHCRDASCWCHSNCWQTRQCHVSFLVSVCVFGHSHCLACQPLFTHVTVQYWEHPLHVSRAATVACVLSVVGSLVSFQQWQMVYAWKQETAHCEISDAVNSKETVSVSLM